MLERQYAIFLPRADTTGQPMLIGPFPTKEDAEEYVRLSKAEQDVKIYPIVTSVEDASDDPDLV